MKQGFAVCLAALLGVSAADAAVDHQSFDEIALGGYLATVGDCLACHTPPGGKPYSGGRALETPFGTLVATNLTPDRATGIGAWSDQEFVDALQQGRGLGGGHLYPAMPYTYYTKVTREDALAIRAFLATVEPVQNEVIANQLPFPYDIRASMAVWNALFFTAGTFKPVAGKSDEWNRGAYLTDGLGHCGACHTTKNWLGGDETSHALQGGVLQGWFSPDLTGDPRSGLGNWSVEDIATYLKTGHNRISAATGPMAEVVTDSTSLMTDADLKAIAVYLKDQPAQDGASSGSVSVSDAAMHAGEAIYLDNCVACHEGGGTGIAQLFSALKGSPSVQSSDATTLIRVVLQGAQSVATDPVPTGPSMPALGWKLSDEEVASVITYIRNSWGNAAASVSAGEVRSVRQMLAREKP